VNLSALPETGKAHRAARAMRDNHLCGIAIAA